MKARLAPRPPVPMRAQRQVVAQPRDHSIPAQPNLRVIDGNLDAGTLLRLQTVAGNQAVGDLLHRPRLSVQAQAVACPPPPAPATPLLPEQDPRFQTVAGKVGAETGKQKQHPPAKHEVGEAHGAALGPTNEVASQADAAKVDEVSQKKPKGFDRAGFIAAVHAAIERASPKSMEEVDDFQKSGKAAQVKEQVVGKVGDNKDAAAKDIKDANAATPDTSKASPKPVTPMAPPSPGARPADVRAADAMPPPKPEEQVALDHTRCETDSQLSENHVTQEQVDKSNEPQFQDAMSAKKEADVHAEAAPQQFRQDEQQQLDQSKSGAAAATLTGLSQVHQSRTSSVGHVGTHKDEAKTRNEAARAKVSTDIEAIYSETKKDVDEILGGLDGKVATAFDTGEKAARDVFENDYKTKKDEYFDDRYSGLGGGLRWLKDKLISPPARVNQFIEEAKQLYLAKMEQVINGVATLVETELNRATNRVDQGRARIKEYVAKQPKDLQKLAQEAAGNVSSRFDEMDQAITDKSSSLVDDLAQKYTAAAQAVEERCNAMREENKGLLEKAKDKIKGMVEAILKIKDMLAMIAAKAASVVDQILSDPIGFLGNLVGAVKQGFEQFVSNIGKHLAEGLMGWLLGELADAGITMPETFDLKGILNLVLQVLGLTWQNIRARAAAILGEEVVGMIEQGVEVFQKVVHIFTTIKEQGLAGLWEMISVKIGDLKAQVMDQIQDFVVTKVITAGVTWIIGLLNPASAFLKACKAIYDIVMFFIERGSQIMALVNAILDNLAAIASGNIGAAASLVESVLAKAIPLVIGFLASLLGVGGISEKIKEVINAVRAPISKAVDWLLKTVVKPVANAAAKAIGWVKGKVKSGADWLKAKAKAGAAAVKSKLAGKKEPAKPGTGGERSPEQKRKDLEAAMQAGNQAAADQGLNPDQVKSKVASIKSEHHVKVLELRTSKKSELQESVHVHGANSPAEDGPEIPKLSLPPQPFVVKVRDGWLIQSPIDAPVRRKYLEKKALPPPSEVGQEGRHRGHLVGAITGHEFIEGIGYESPAMNLVYQAGVEGMMAGLRAWLLETLPGKPLKVWHRAKSTEEATVHAASGEDITVLKAAAYRIYLSAPGYGSAVLAEVDIIVQSDANAPPLIDVTVPDKRFVKMMEEAIADRKAKQMQAIIRRRHATGGSR